MRELSENLQSKLKNLLSMECSEERAEVLDEILEQLFIPLEDDRYQSEEVIYSDEEPYAVDESFDEEE